MTCPLFHLSQCLWSCGVEHLCGPVVELSLVCVVYKDLLAITEL